MADNRRRRSFRRVGLLATAMILATVGWPGASFGQRPADFGQRWVREHPFTLNSQEEIPTSAETYEAAGYNTCLCYWNYNHTLYLHALRGHPWHVILGTANLAEAQARVSSVTTNFTNGGLGWYIKDEPNCDSATTSDMIGMGNIATWLKTQYPDMLIYSNILGYSPWAMYKVDNYISAVHPDVLMYDSYSFHYSSEMDRDTYYARSMNFRAKGLQYNLPVFAWAQTYENYDNLRYPSESEHRLEMYGYLAMGHKGLSDFIYTWNDNKGTIVTTAGVPTAMYDIVADVNPEILRLGNVLKFATSTDVRFVPGYGNSPPDGLTNWSAGAGGDSHITAIQLYESGSNKNGLIGFFEDDRGEEMFLLVNECRGRTLTASAATSSFSVTFDSGVDSLLRLNQKTGEQEVVPLFNHVLNVALLGGTGNLYKYNDGVMFIPEPGTLTMISSMLVFAGLALWRRRDASLIASDNSSAFIY